MNAYRQLLMAEALALPFSLAFRSGHVTHLHPHSSLRLQFRSNVPIFDTSDVHVSVNDTQLSEISLEK